MNRIVRRARLVCEHPADQQAQRYRRGELGRDTRETTSLRAVSPCGPTPAIHSIHLRVCRAAALSLVEKVSNQIGVTRETWKF